ncbi:MAG: sigma-70 family RNA polymerase sigma factor [Eubacteriales bacterium]|nr:sigma-70 family RNA polymerase sigma factor [Eubacteriales bacterium]
MKKISKLTIAEQQFASEHHDDVKKFLNHYRLSEDDFYDVVVFGYLCAVQEYLGNPKLQEYSFKTIAWNQMHSALVDEYKYRNRSKRKAVITTYNEENAMEELNQFLPQRTMSIEEHLHDQEILQHLLTYLTPKEREAVRLKADGYTYREIAEHCQISVYSVRNRFSRFRRRLLTVHVVPKGGSAA